MARVQGARMRAHAIRQDESRRARLVARAVSVAYAQLRTHRGDGDEDPHRGYDEEAQPEDIRVGGVDDALILEAHEMPVRLARLVDHVPPSQPHEQPAGDVFHCDRKHTKIVGNK